MMVEKKTSKGRPRKERIDSKDAAVRIVQGAAREILPPDHVALEAVDMPFWRSIVSEFPKVDWTDHQLEMAALLARTMRALDQEQKTLLEEGFVHERANGTTVENPRARSVQTLSSSVLSLRRSLALHARGRTDIQTIGKRKEEGRKLEKLLTETDDLLPVPGAALQ